MSIVECITANSLRLDQTWWQIYEDSFPAECEGGPTPAIVAAVVRAIYFDKYAAMNAIDRSILEELLGELRFI